MLRDFFSLFFPKRCAACKQVLVCGEQWVCTRCVCTLPHTDYHRMCENTVLYKLCGRTAVHRAAAMYAFRKGGRVQHLLHCLKYGDMPQMGIWLGERYGAMLKLAGWHSILDVIVPVPLHQKRLQQRGYNQSAVFAAGLSRSLSIPWSDQLLQRVRSTESQTGKSRRARIQNVENAFCMGPDWNRQAKPSVLLVDDVITTGATLEACCQALLLAGAVEISVAALAVAE